jgi:hypothetical protein
VTEEKLTEKEWDVLKFFLKKEGEAIDTSIDSHRSDSSKNFQSLFCSYPEEMIKQGLVNTSKPKIISACKKLCKEEILKTKENKAKNNRKTIFYSLNSNSIALMKNLVGRISKKSPKEAIEILSYRYFSYYIDESLVREILSEKCVSISRCIPWIEWEKDEAQQLLNYFFEKNFNPEEPYTKFDDLLKKVIIEYEKYNKKEEKEYLDDLNNLFKQFFENLDKPSHDAIKYYYSKDYMLYLNLSFKERLSLRRDISEFLNLFLLRNSLCIKLPVFSDAVSQENKIETIRRVNRRLFFEERSDFEGLTEKDIAKNYSGLRAHYSTFEYERLVLPILALVWCSPSALYEFLCGEWEGFEMHFTIDGECEERGFFTKLLHTATKDILVNLDIPRNSIVESVSSKQIPPSRNPFCDSFRAKSSHKERQFNKQTTDIDYENIEEDCENIEDASWDLKHYPEIESLLNSSLRIKLKHLWEIIINIGFSVVSGSIESPKIIKSIRMCINYDLLPVLFEVNDIKDAQSLISKLQQKNYSIYCYILNKFSNKLKNIVLLYDTREQPSIQLQHMIVEELNSIILDGHFYDERVFASFVQENENLNQTIKELSSYRYSKKEILNMVDKNTSFESSIISNNRYLLEKIFENELEQR